jgi:Flp pilus assembly pilin Flp
MASTVAKRKTSILAQVLRNRRGAIMVEYAMLLTLVGMPVALGCVAGGVAMLKQYVAARDAILSPHP